MSKSIESRVTWRKTRIACLSLIVVLLATGAARAESILTYSIRSLVVQSSTIVQARPVDPTMAKGQVQAFKVTEVLKGPAIRTGTTITVWGMEEYHLGMPDQLEKLAGGEPSPVVRVILFLNPTGGAEAKPGVFDLTHSGIRCLDANDNVLWPWQWMNPGGLNLVPEKGADWDKIIARVRSDVPKVAGAMALRGIKDPAERNQAIFAWIEKHRGEFKENHFAPAGGEPNEPPGWAELESDTFNWIMDTCRPDDGWRALKLAREVTGEPVQRYGSDAPAFGSPEGRKLLLGVILDAKQAPTDRKLALDWLYASCWVKRHQERHPGLADITPKEQAEIILKLSPLLKDADHGVRGLAARAIADASSPRDGSRRDRDTDAALPALIDAYRNEPPSYTRNEMAEIVLRLGGENAWVTASGNPGGILVVLQSLCQRNDYGRDRICFQMNNFSLGTHNTITDQPTLIMERLGDKGEVQKRVSMPLPVSYPQDLWKKGWSNCQGCISVEVPRASLAKGRWRFTVEGTTGKEVRVQWHSEPEVIELDQGK